jgi:hypothetical protein
MKTAEDIEDALTHGPKIATAIDGRAVTAW